MTRRSRYIKVVKQQKDLALRLRPSFDRIARVEKKNNMEGDRITMLIREL